MYNNDLAQFSQDFSSFYLYSDEEPATMKTIYASGLCIKLLGYLGLKDYKTILKPLGPETFTYQIFRHGQDHYI
jgi:hypothetical protein